MNNYLLNTIRDGVEDSLYKKYIDYLKVDLDGFSYAYGENMIANYPIRRKNNLSFYRQLLHTLFSSANAKRFINKDKNILTFVDRIRPQDLNAYGWNFIGSCVQPTNFSLVKSKSLFEFYFYYNKIDTKLNFNEIIKKEVFEKLEEYKEQLKEEYKKYNFKALFVGNGEPYMFKLHLDIFRELEIPSFIFLHGIPGIYNLETEKKADYLLVWGEKIRKNYIDCGFDPKRVIVTGHPGYKNLNYPSKLRNDLEDVLVMTTASVSWSPHGWDSSHFPINDRSLLINYCYSIEKVLKKLGVKKARLRPHPSVNKKWMEEFVDTDFYSLDYETLSKSINKASIVIGCTSTTCFEALLAGVNYVIYEPAERGRSMFGSQLVPPFDGSDAKIRVAYNEDSLYDMLMTKYLPDLSIISDYIQPYDASIVNNLLSQSL